MAKIFVEGGEDAPRVPFLRGILIRSLQDAGLPFDAAYKLAMEVRDSLDDTPSITTHQLRQKVLELLQANVGQNIYSRYEKQERSFVIQVAQRDGQLTTFSRFEYQHDLKVVGLTSEEALDVATTVYQHLTDRQLEVITTRRLGELPYRYLRKTSDLGPAVAHRWLVWRDFINSGRPLVFLIGGTAGSGKSTVATMLASHLEIVRTQSTDMLREVMRIMMPKQLIPVLHTSSFLAWMALPGQSKIRGMVSETQLINGYRSQADLLAVAIEAVISRAMSERVSLILEGVHIYPGLIEKLSQQDDCLVIPIMLGVLKQKHLRRRIRGRGIDVPQRRADRYLKHFDEIWRLQSYLLSEADRANVPIIVNDDRDIVFREIMRITIDTLAEDFDKKPQAVFA